MPFIREESIDIIQTGDTTFQLVKPVSYQGAKETFVVPAGQDTDFASVPAALMWLIPRYGRWTKAAILHDYLWRSGVINKTDADGIFRRALRELGVPLYKRWMMWSAVRVTSIMKHREFKETPKRDLVILLFFSLFNIAFLAIPVVVIFVWTLLFKAINAFASLFDGKMRRDLAEAESMGQKRDVLL